ncbi:5'-nucleotidase C-terminal domain-containing protein [Lysinibacillus sp. OL1_EC]|uniref:5'-nucleotidase C-terminal domain-containing protein n=1 Tax=unclassified Lysinibacillus TaxID=2636778 RepID=UPI00103B36A6|nr:MULTISPECIES: 5'-nucleotidase C-terminal domain-containing protein [unclassified Lysinibacillus]MCM0623456.1 5'-nucleotidase C-terminal domain-containing protein [Lysinibacillus sp. OL1_EC]TBV89633.1 bifunctional metallophosphatase/5'-nucleotidase [Lysinibacillus sp. OL1]WGT39645.1 5'-nucleotidase C-terminal domain-containing protein [Lysinibacillus sp. 1 U-2021]
MENKRNKFLTVTAAALAVTAVAVVPASAASPFSDVKESHADFEGISTLYAAGIISGYPDGTFKPDTNVTRGQAAKMIAGALKLDTKEVEDPKFTDISASNPYYGSIAALVGLNVITGYGDNTFRPNQTITHGDLAKILASIPTLPELESAKNHEASEKVTRGQLATFIAEALTKSNPETPETPETPEDAFSLSILHVNDTHARANELPKLATAVKEQREAKKNVLTLHAGDAFNGTLYFNEFHGQADLALLNEIGFDAMVFGNHEFDLGASPEGHQALADFVKGAKFPFVDANTDFSADAKFTGLFTDLISSEPENGKIYSGIVKEIDGEKVGIFGLTTEETADIASPDKVTFTNYIEEAKKAVAAFEGMGVNKIIALTHIGYNDNPNVDNDILLAKNVPGIDVIVGAHDHTKLDEPFVVDTNTVGEAKDATLIVQANEYVKYLGTLDVTFDGDGVVTEYGGELIDLGKVAEDETLVKLLAPYKAKVDEVNNKEIGVTLKEALANPRASETSLESVRSNETALGNIITDGMLAKAQKYTDKTVVMALQNGGGIREAIPAGNITVGQVITVLPFGNTLALMDATGAELKAAFEVSLKNAPKENGGFLHIAGAKLQYDSSKEVGSRVVSIEYLDKATGKYVAIEDGKTYTVATNAYTAKGGDGLDMFAKAYEEGRVTDLGLSDWENLQEQLLSLKEVKTTTEGRIVDVAKKQ